jgi:hypothetical protein
MSIFDDSQNKQIIQTFRMFRSFFREMWEIIRTFAFQIKRIQLIVTNKKAKKKYENKISTMV